MASPKFAEVLAAGGNPLTAALVAEAEAAEEAAALGLTSAVGSGMLATALGSSPDLVSAAAATEGLAEALAANPRLAAAIAATPSQVSGGMGAQDGGETICPSLQK
mgnify:CR=1 FL=1